MKYHISLKFFAVFLAALMLLTAIGSAAGIICLASADLYEQSVDKLYEEEMATTRRNFAVNLAHRYASLNIGGCPEEYLNEYFGISWMFNTFQSGYYFYTIKDENGNIVENTLEEDMAGATHYTIQVTDIRYRCALDADLEEEDTQGRTLEDATEPDAANTDGSTKAGTEGDTDATDDAENITSPTEEETVPTDVVSGAEQEPTEDSTIYLDGYWDSASETYQEFRFHYAELPPYTVDLYLLPGAAYQDTYWDVLSAFWEYRIELFYVLGISILLFAMCAVYLCCALGRRPGTQDVRPGGLNRLPLDVYAVGCCSIIVAICLFEFQFIGYLSRSYLAVGVMAVILGGYACCLVFVGFCCGFVAQIKAEKGYWWRHSAVGWCVLKVWHGLKWLGKKTAAAVRCTIALLPVTWQWLATAAAMKIWLVLTFVLMLSVHGVLRGLFVLLFLSALAGCIFVVCYGAYCFGTLMRGAQDMAKGDLDRKIQTKYMFGVFLNFAQQLNALADAARIAAERQMRSECIKTELITNVSHDIKTPLTSLINYVDLLQKPHTPEEETTYLEVLQRQSQRLKKLVEDLMDMSKASTGNVPVDICAIDATEAVNQALGEFSEKLEQARLILIFRTPEEPVSILADGKLMWRVMSNLLGNAVKYAMPGTRLYVDLVTQGDKVAISMKNISREALNVSADELVERFVRGDTARNTEGSGLGLNIAKSLMELQRGELQLLVDGDLFKVTLIFAKSQ